MSAETISEEDAGDDEQDTNTDAGRGYSHCMASVTPNAQLNEVKPLKVDVAQPFSCFTQLQKCRF